MHLTYFQKIAIITVGHVREEFLQYYNVSYYFTPIMVFIVIVIIDNYNKHARTYIIALLTSTIN